jgi:hypothetical protein
MSEIAPSPRHAKDERDELDALEAQVARKRTEVKGNEAFGKYDQVEGPLNRDDRPIAGSYADYHSRRPSGGIVRDSGVGLRQAETGHTASAADYEAQAGDTQEYYDKLMNAENQEVLDPADYKDMGVMQLAKEQAKAELLGDMDGAKEMRGIFDVHMLEQAATEGSGITDADLDKESGRYARLVEKFKASMEPSSGVDTGAVSEEAVSSATRTTEAGAEATPEGSKFPGQEVELYKPKDEFEKGVEVIFNGKKMTIEDVLSGAGVNAYLLVDADGNKSLAFAEQLAVLEKEPSLGDKLKNLWSKGKESVKKLFRPEYWGERFTAASNNLQEASTWALNLGVKETDSDEEADKKRNRNRVLFIAGGAALAVAAVAGASYGIGFAVGSGGEHHAATEALNNGRGHSAAAGNVLSAHDQAIADALTPKHGTDLLQPSPDVVAPAPEAIPAGFNISSGEGGEQLFNSLNINPQNWYANQESFLRNFPNDFYRMPGGGVGIAHQGLLSPEARNAIEALK